MPYTKSPRPYLREWKAQQARMKKDPEIQKDRDARARARYAFDKAGISREGKDIEHIRPLSKGGKNVKSNLRLETPHDNRSFYRNADHTVKRNVSRKKK